MTSLARLMTTLCLLALAKAQDLSTAE